MLGGGQVEKPHAGIHFPGARCPRHELVHLPEKIIPLPDVLKQASEHASNIMRGIKSTNGGLETSAPAVNGGETVRSPAEQRLGALLKKQAAMVEDTSVDEAAYARLVSEIAEAQAEVTATKQIGAQHGG
jgi:hypothetical protein